MQALNGGCRYEFSALWDSTTLVDKSDRVRISDKLQCDAGDSDHAGVMGRHYEFVRRFSVAPHALLAVDALVIAECISSTLHNYSRLQHMCFLFATVLFLALEEWAGAQPDAQRVTVERGTQYHMAGKIQDRWRRQWRLVDVETGQLEHAFRVAEPVLRRYQAVMTQLGATRKEARQALDVIRHEMEVFRSAGWCFTVLAVVAEAKRAVPAMWLDIGQRSEKIQVSKSA